MPPRFEGKFGIPPSHSAESELTKALYRLPESITPEYVESFTEDLVSKVNQVREKDDSGAPLSETEVLTLQLKLSRHFEDNGNAVPINVPTCVDALLESPKFLQSDKGSIEKLFEMHEMKTLQKIAELRRKRSEYTGESELNPYEALFETPSGAYYLARLLNMPHLEQESEYMDHCVGTSESYINKVKRGEVEIFSLRNKSDHKPLVTIEFDAKSGALLQVKTEHDNNPTHKDQFFDDLLASIEMLQGTLDDNNKARKVNTEAVDYYHKIDTLVEKNEVNQSFSKEELRFIYEVDNSESGFEGQHDYRLVELVQNRNRQKDIETMCDCPTHAVATEINNITKTTQVYCKDSGNKLSFVDFREEKNREKLPQIIEFSRAFKDTGSGATLDVSIEGGIVSLDLKPETIQALDSYQTARRAYETADSTPSYVYSSLENIPWQKLESISLQVLIIEHGHTTPEQRDTFVADMDNAGYRPLTFSELVALGIERPDLNKRYEVLHTYDKHMIDGAWRAPFLIWDGDERCLSASHVDVDWSAHFRFLFVRK